MRRLVLLTCAVLVTTILCSLVPTLASASTEFDRTFNQFVDLLSLQSEQEIDTQHALEDHEQELALLEQSSSQSQPYLATYPQIYVPTQPVHPAIIAPSPYVVGGAGYAPVIAPTVASSPISAYVHHPATLQPFGVPYSDGNLIDPSVRGGYNVHGLMPTVVYGGYHPNLAADLQMLAGKAKDGAAAGAGGAGGAGGAAPGGDAPASSMPEVPSLGFLEEDEYPLASASHSPDNIAADASSPGYGLYPAASPEVLAAHSQYSSEEYILGPHKLGFAGVGKNKKDSDFPALLEAQTLAEVEAESQMEAQAELEAEAELDADAEAILDLAEDVEGESDSDADSDAESESESDADADVDSEAELDSDSEESSEFDDGMDSEYDDPSFLQQLPGAPGAGGAGGGDAGGAAGGAGGASANPSYTLPYPPVLPGHYAPLFNPYTNVNPLASPLSNYAAQPGSHPAVAGVISQQMVGNQGAYPYYPYSGQLGVNPAYGGQWIHPQNLNSASVGTNANAATLGQFIEIAESQSDEDEHGECHGCHYRE